MPASASVGTSGSSAERFGAFTASGLHPAGLDVRLHARQAVEQHRHAAVGDVRDGERGALVRDVHQVHAGEHLEQLAVQMHDGADAAGGEVELPGARLGVGDQLLHARHRQLRAHHQDVGHVGDVRDRREVPAAGRRAASAAPGRWNACWRSPSGAYSRRARSSPRGPSRSSRRRRACSPPPPTGPCCSPSFCATMRPTMSVAPAGGKGTTASSRGSGTGPGRRATKTASTTASANFMTIPVYPFSAGTLPQKQRELPGGEAENRDAGDDIDGAQQARTEPLAQRAAPTRRAAPTTRPSRGTRRASPARPPCSRRSRRGRVPRRSPRRRGWWADWRASAPSVERNAWARLAGLAISPSAAGFASSVFTPR